MTAIRKFPPHDGFMGEEPEIKPKERKYEP